MNIWGCLIWRIHESSLPSTDLWPGRYAGDLEVAIAEAKRVWRHLRLSGTCVSFS
jgi:hypothetical protein